MEVTENTRDLTWLTMRVLAGFVFLWAGIGKLFMGAAPPVDQIITFMPANVSLFILGLLEFVLGTLLILGLLTRIAGGAATALYVIFIIVGLTLGMFNTAMLWKDLGLAGMTFALTIFGAHTYSLDAWLKKKKYE